ncbi:YIP1 family protein [Patescibacteria group bacterium]|nr:YIP1 family protein [Patescibacteria group bacterium]MBU1683786.1 YIP1 family protein [Patescibacteria group bacterium]MBU1935591.1 YIP1 family protein [Patescibacteria group bacterium]
MHETSFVSELKRAVQIVLFNEQEMNHLAGDKGKTKYGLYIIITGALLVLLSNMAFLSGFVFIGSSLFMALKQVLIMIIGIYLTSLIAQKVFKGHGTHDGFFRVAAYGSILAWLGALQPFLMRIFGIFGGAFGLFSLIVGIWSLILMYVIIKTVHKLASGGALGTMAIMIGISIIIGMLLGYGKGGYGYMNKSYDFATPFGEATVDVLDEDSFEMNIPGEDGMGNVRMEDGTMTITGPDGETMTITIPER